MTYRVNSPHYLAQELCEYSTAYELALRVVELEKELEKIKDGQET